MKWIDSPVGKWPTVAALVVLSLANPVLLQAQQKELSVEELERYIEQQKAALEEVQANREDTEKKVQDIQKALDAQEARRQRVEDEMKQLCQAREALQPDTYDDCMAQADN